MGFPDLPIVNLNNKRSIKDLWDILVAKSQGENNKNLFSTHCGLLYLNIGQTRIINSDQNAAILTLHGFLLSRKESQRSIEDALRIGIRDIFDLNGNFLQIQSTSHQSANVM